MLIEYLISDITFPLQLDDWVLCRIYNKKGVIEKQPAEVDEERKPVGWKRPRANSSVNPNLIQTSLKKEEVESELGEIWHVTQAPPQVTAPFTDNMLYFDSSKFVPFNPYKNGDSSCSEHVLSPEFTCEEEAESQSSNYWGGWENGLGMTFNNETAMNGFGPVSPAGFCRDPVFQPDMFTYLHKPF
jgi:hypothetical protein